MTKEKAWRERKCLLCGDVYTSRATLCLKHWINWAWGTLSKEDKDKLKEIDLHTKAKYYTQEEWEKMKGE